MCIRELNDRLCFKDHLWHAVWIIPQRCWTFPTAITDLLEKGIYSQDGLCFDVVGVVLFAVTMVICYHNSRTRATRTIYITITARRVVVPTIPRTAVPGSLLVTHHQLMITMVTACAVVVYNC